MANTNLGAGTVSLIFILTANPLSGVNAIMTRSTHTVKMTIVAALCLLAGCATGSFTTGKPIPRDKVDQIIDGQTTMLQIITMFGKPEQESRMGDHTLYTYKHTKTKSNSSFFPYWANTESEERSDELTITFDKNDVVVTHSITRGI